MFVRISAVEPSGLSGLEDGDEVPFKLEQDRSGKLAAMDLHVTGSAPSWGRPSRSTVPSRGFAREEGGPRSDRGSGVSGSGVVKWFNTQKGFGFIQPSDGGADIFVHISAVERAGLRDLPEGQPVSYEIEQERRTGKASAADLRLERD